MTILTHQSRNNQNIVNVDLIGWIFVTDVNVIFIKLSFKYIIRRKFLKQNYRNKSTIIYSFKFNFVVVSEDDLIGRTKLVQIIPFMNQYYYRHLLLF